MIEERPAKPQPQGTWLDVHHCLMDYHNLSKNLCSIQIIIVIKIVLPFHNDFRCYVVCPIASLVGAVDAQNKTSCQELVDDRYDVLTWQDFRIQSRCCWREQLYPLLAPKGQGNTAPTFHGRRFLLLHFVARGTSEWTSYVAHRHREELKDGGGAHQ